MDNLLVQSRALISRKQAVATVTLFQSKLTKRTAMSKEIQRGDSAVAMTALERLDENGTSEQTA